MQRCAALGLVSRVSGDLLPDAFALADRPAQGPTAAYGMTEQAVRAWSRDRWPTTSNSRLRYSRR